ncbi:YceI family protein [Variovorax sp. J22R133]|uniref:YceI family protein n=1 Tax=Variovorax brevis TaxID=3053503 RepID=UPI0025759EDE|nr:YceI family protein [Variovorax sp. J22R133]MDM0112724.1 YceI family protein [Variovorax sp. J22R133]
MATLLRRAGLAFLVAMVLAGCAQPGGERAGGSFSRLAASQVPEGFPLQAYQQAVAQGKTVLRIDPAQSLVTITARRGGSLARFGHDHIVASRAVQGYVSPGEGRANLFVPLADLTVDEPALRAEAGFDTQPGANDIEGTRSNMLDKVLEVQRFPFALVEVSGMEAAPAGSVLKVAITLHGVRRTLDVPVQVDSQPDGMRVSGMFELNQSDFDIVPFSILGGAVQVQDRLGMRFAIRAGRLSD